MMAQKGFATQIVVEQSLPRTQPEPNWKSKVYTVALWATWHSQADNRLSCELDDIESPYQPSNIVLL